MDSSTSPASSETNGRMASASTSIRPCSAIRRPPPGAARHRATRGPPIIRSSSAFVVADDGGGNGYTGGSGSRCEQAHLRERASYRQSPQPRCRPEPVSARSAPPPPALTLRWRGAIARLRSMRRLGAPQIIGVRVNVVLVSDISLVPKGIHGASDSSSTDSQPVGEGRVFDLLARYASTPGISS